MKGVVFAVAVAILLAVGVVGYRSTRAAEATLMLVNRTSKVLQTVDQLTADYSRAVTARRAYVIAGDPSQLGELSSLDAALRRSLAAARELMLNDPSQQRRLDALAQAMAENLGDLDSSVERRNRIGREVDQPQQVVLSTNVRTLLEAIADETHGQLTEQTAKTEQDLKRARLAELGGGAISIALLVSLFYAMRREIERRRQTQAELVDAKNGAESANAELREARTAAEDASGAKSEFLSAMSHEVRTPLNAVLGFAQLLQRDKKEPLSNRHRERVDQILRSGEHLLRLIDDVLDLSRIEARALPMSVEPVSVEAVLTDLSTNLESMASNHQVMLETVPVSSELPPVAADRTRLMQILMNFGSNAIKYNRPAGKVTILALTAAEGRVRIMVLDTGPGIPEDKQNQLFQPFKRAGQENGPIPGNGIGLAITKRLAEMMDAAVGFESVPGEGSRFWVDLRA
jgi:signal transduction histidine kinase